MPDISGSSVEQLRSAIDAHELTRRAAVEASMRRAEELDPALNAFTHLRPQAPDEAEAATGRLAGIPVAIKDCFVDHDRPPTMGSKVSASWMKGTAAVLHRLRAAGAVPIGYANMHEWAIGLTSTVTATGPIRNPYDLARSAGGSSGGSAAAVAAGIVPAAIGSDAGGSIRCPAAHCGIVGLKPTWGRVPMEGFADEGTSIDHVGPLARTVGDVRTLLEVMLGDRVDSRDPRSLRLGVARNFWRDLDPGFEQALDRALGVLRGLVDEVRDIEVPLGETAGWAIGYILLPATAELVARDLDLRPQDFDPWTLTLLRFGAALRRPDRTCGSPHLNLVNVTRRFLSTKATLRFPDLPRPLRRVVGKHLVNREQGEFARRFAADAWDRVFETVDVVVTPTMPAPPPLIDDPVVELPSGKVSPDKAYLPLTGPMNLGGVPALTLPCGRASDAWSVSMTLTAARGKDGIALSLGEAFEKATASQYANQIAPSSAEWSEATAIGSRHDHSAYGGGGY